MFLGKITYEFDTNDRWVIKTALEFLETHLYENDDSQLRASMGESADWLEKRAGFLKRQFQER